MHRLAHTEKQRGQASLRKRGCLAAGSAPDPGRRKRSGLPYPVTRAGHGAINLNCRRRLLCARAAREPSTPTGGSAPARHPAGSARSRHGGRCRQSLSFRYPQSVSLCCRWSRVAPPERS